MVGLRTNIRDLHRLSATSEDQLPYFELRIYTRTRRRDVERSASFNHLLKSRQYRSMSRKASALRPRRPNEGAWRRISDTGTSRPLTFCAEELSKAYTVDVSVRCRGLQFR